MVALLAIALTLLHSPLKNVVLTEQPNKPVHLKLGQVLVFSVFGNASTGANWTVKRSGKPGLVSVQVETAKPKSVKPKVPPIVGQGGTYDFGFRAVKKGTYKVVLLYGRSWEMAKGKAPWGKISATVLVR